MNKIKSVTLQMLMISSFFFYSCEKKDGYAKKPDFKEKNLVLSNENQVKTLKAKNNVKWFFTDFRVNGKTIQRDDWDKNPLIKYKSSLKKDPENKYIHLTGIYNIEYDDWFVLEKKDNTTLNIRLSKNESENKREIHFEASVGNAGDKINIIQHPPYEKKEAYQKDL